jgi:cytochrome c5
MNRSNLCVFVFLLLSGLAFANAALAHTAQKAEQSAPNNAQSTSAPAQNAQPTGDAVFKANCGRCHVPPMAIPPRITGTVIMHMRTRARLSRQDELLLLKFMAP